MWKAWKCWSNHLVLVSGKLVLQKNVLVEFWFLRQFEVKSRRTWRKSFFQKLLPNTFQQKKKEMGKFLLIFDDSQNFSVEWEKLNQSFSRFNDFKSTFHGKTFLWENKIESLNHNFFGVLHIIFLCLYSHFLNKHLNPFLNQNTFISFYSC